MSSKQKIRVRLSVGVHSKVAKLADALSDLDSGETLCRFKSYPYCKNYDGPGGSLQKEKVSVSEADLFFTSAFSSMVEHRAHNARDTGSVPVRPTKLTNTRAFTCLIS